MKTLIIFCIFQFITLPCYAGLKILTTTTDLKSITEQLIAPNDQVNSLLTGKEDPHYVEAKPSYISKARNTDLLIVIGLDLEASWVPELIRQSNNPKIAIGKPGYLTTELGIRVLEIPQQISRAHGDIHAQGNPHYWLNPNNGLIIARQISQRLQQLNPSQTQIYRENLTKFNKKIVDHLSKWQAETAILAGKSIITYHRSLSYLADWLKLDVIGTLEPIPGVPPTAKHLQSLKQAIQKEQLLGILLEPHLVQKSAQNFAQQIDSKIIEIPTSVGATSNATNYFSLFDQILAQLN